MSRLSSQKYLCRNTKLGLLFVLILVDSLLLYVFISYSHINSFGNSDFGRMLDGTGQRPYVTRVLVPWLTLGLKAIVPVKVNTVISEWVAYSSFLTNIVIAYRVPIEYRLEGLLNILLQIISLVGFHIYFIKLARRVFVLSNKSLIFFTFVASFGLLPFFNYGYIYDLPQLFLCTFAFFLIASHSKAGYFIVFVFAVLNKETSILLIIPSILLFWDSPKPRITRVVAGLMVQLLIFLWIRVPLYAYFQRNTGENIEIHILDHLDVLIYYPVISVVVLLTSTLVVILLIHNWKKKPALITLGVVVGFVLLILFFIGGFPFEFRVFYEVYGVVVLSVTWSILTLRKFTISINALTTEQFIESIRLEQGKTS